MHHFWNGGSQILTEYLTLEGVAYDITSYRALTVGTTEFRFSLNSQVSSLPHISQIQADRVANGTMISCSVNIQGNIQDTQSTTICIIGSGCGKNA